MLYGSRTASVSVNLQAGDGPGGASTNNGETGEKDTVSNVEVATGGSGADILVGNDFDNNLLGGAGNDLIFGYGGQDQLDGGKGDDYLDANFAGFFGSPGRGADGVRDALDCGADNDTAMASPSDTDLVADCETVLNIP